MLFFIYMVVVKKSLSPKLLILFRMPACMTCGAVYLCSFMYSQWNFDTGTGHIHTGLGLDQNIGSCWTRDFGEKRRGGEEKFMFSTFHNCVVSNTHGQLVVWLVPATNPELSHWQVSPNLQDHQQMHSNTFLFVIYIEPLLHDNSIVLQNVIVA